MQEVQGKVTRRLRVPGIKDRKGAEETYYFLSIDFPPKGSLTWVSSEFIHHLNGQAKTAINI